MMMRDYDESVEINYSLNWPYISKNPYNILIIGGSGSGKTNVLLNIINHQLPHIDKTHLYVQDSYESKYQLLTNAREKVVENQKRSNSFFDYWQTIDDVYEGLEDYNPTKKTIVLIVFDDKIASMKA